MWGLQQNTVVEKKILDHIPALTLWLQEAKISEIHGSSCVQ